MISVIVVKYDTIYINTEADDGVVSHDRAYLELKKCPPIQGILSSNDFIPMQSRIND